MQMKGRSYLCLPIAPSDARVVDTWVSLLSPRHRAGLLSQLLPLVFGQHFLDSNFQNDYQSGWRRCNTPGLELLCT